MQVRLPRELHAWLVSQAAAANRSLNAEIVAQLEQSAPRKGDPATLVDAIAAALEKAITGAMQTAGRSEEEIAATVQEIREAVPAQSDAIERGLRIKPPARGRDMIDDEGDPGS